MSWKKSLSETAEPLTAKALEKAVEAVQNASANNWPNITFPVYPVGTGGGKTYAIDAKMLPNMSGTGTEDSPYIWRVETDPDVWVRPANVKIDTVKVSQPTKKKTKLRPKADSMVASVHNAGLVIFGKEIPDKHDLYIGLDVLKRGRGTCMHILLDDILHTNWVSTEEVVSVTVMIPASKVEIETIIDVRVLAVHPDTRFETYIHSKPSGSTSPNLSVKPIDVANRAVTLNGANIIVDGSGMMKVDVLASGKYEYTFEGEAPEIQSIQSATSMDHQYIVTRGATGHRYSTGEPVEWVVNDRITMDDRMVIGNPSDTYRFVLGRLARSRGAHKRPRLDIPPDYRFNP
jgi:hypothetical protein